MSRFAVGKYASRDPRLSTSRIRLKIYGFRVTPNANPCWLVNYRGVRFFTIIVVTASMAANNFFFHFWDFLCAAIINYDSMLATN